PPDSYRSTPGVSRNRAGCATPTLRGLTPIDADAEGGRAQVGHGALLAAGGAGVADAAAVEDQDVRDLQPARARVELHQHPLDLVRVGVAGQPEPLRQPPHV